MYATKYKTGHYDFNLEEGQTFDDIVSKSFDELDIEWDEEPIEEIDEIQNFEKAKLINNN